MVFHDPDMTFHFSPLGEAKATPGKTPLNPLTWFASEWPD